MERCVAIWIAALATACGGMTEGEQGKYPNVDGEYWRYGTQVNFVDDELGPKSEFRAGSLQSMSARLFTEGQQLTLDLPDCFDVALDRSGENGQVLTASSQDCPLSAMPRVVTSRTLMDLRIDLDDRTIHLEYCQSGPEHARCATEDGVFVPRTGLATDGFGGSSAADEPIVTTGDTESDVLWSFEEGIQWTCDELDEAVPECTSGPGLMDRRTQSVDGTVHRLRDGSLYLDGYDCLAPAGYDGEPVLCGQSLNGLSSVVPELWMTRFLVEDDQLSFQAELRGSGFLHHVRLEAPLRRL
jgi:hypothetical protein